MGEGQVRGGKASRSGQSRAEPRELGLEEYPAVTLFYRQKHPGPVLYSGVLLHWLESKSPTLLSMEAPKERVSRGRKLLAPPCQPLT